MAKTKTSNAVKDRWNKQNYEDWRVRIPNGRKSTVEARAQQVGESVNGYVNGLIRADLGLSGDEWKEGNPDA